MIPQRAVNKTKQNKGFCWRSLKGSKMLSVKLHVKSCIPLLPCILYIKTPDISSLCVSTGALVSRSLNLDNVEDLDIVCSVAGLCT